MVELNDVQNALPEKRSGGLSRRGESDAQTVHQRMSQMRKIFKDQYDPLHNPKGIVIMGIADNSLCRKELVRYFTEPGRLVLEPRDLTYADGFFASHRVLQAISDLYNTVPDGFYTKDNWSPPLTKVEPDHLIIGNGATEIIEVVAWALCDPGDGVLLSTPYYNAFDEDLTLRAHARIIPVQTPVPRSAFAQVQEPVESFAKDTIAAYQDAYDKAKQEGIQTKVLLVCNPHNPTGCIYPRETIVELARFAARNDLHLVMDEIYARSVFPSRDVPNPTQFDSILRMDTQAEAGLSPSRVHVISSASKDYSINGFRLGIFISQHNKDVINALTMTARFAQTAAPAGQLFTSLINNKEYLNWFLTENRSRLTKTYNYVTEYLQHHEIPYVASNAGHFLLIDLRKFLVPKRASNGSSNDVQLDSRGKPLTPERILSNRFIENGVLVAPGSQYHHPNEGFFRLTFSLEPQTLFEGLKRIEKVLELDSFIERKGIVKL